MRVRGFPLVLDVYDAQAALGVGGMDRDEAEELVRQACPGPGGCGVAASFNTWGIALEAIGLMLPFSSSIPAVADEKRKECLQVGPAIRRLIEQNARPRDILTFKAFENAAATIAAIGGSTNAVIHLVESIAPSAARSSRMRRLAGRPVFHHRRRQ